MNVDFDERVGIIGVRNLHAKLEQFAPEGILAVFARDVRQNFSSEHILTVFNRIDPLIFDEFSVFVPIYKQVSYLEANCTCQTGGLSYECLGTGLPECSQGMPGSCTMAPGCGDMGLYHCNGRCVDFPESN